MQTERVAVVTGSTSGIGLGIAARLAQNGYNIMLNGFGASESIQQIMSELESKHGIKVAFCGADLMTEEGCMALIDACVDKFGHIDVLVNNAGFQYVAATEDFPMEQWHRVMALNLTAPFCLTRLVLPLMRRRQWGRIVNISSVHGVVASLHKSAYVASKHGLLGLTKVVALETARTHITCNAVCPGWVETPLVKAQIEQRMAESGKTYDEEKEALLMEKQPSGEFSRPEQVGGLVAFLCSEDASQIRGAVMTMDGGWTIQ